MATTNLTTVLLGEDKVTVEEIAKGVCITTTGDTLTGPLVGVAPQDAGDLTRKDYVDGLIGSISTDAFVQKSGDTLTGQLKGVTPVDVDDLTRKDYVDGLLLEGSGFILRSGDTMEGFLKGVTPVDVNDFTTKEYVDGLIGGDGYLPLTGGTLTGPVFGITPTTGSELATKDYVDVNGGGSGDAVWGSILGSISAQTDLMYELNDKLDLTGGTLTGYVSGLTPTSDAHFVTKQYADNLSSGGGSIWGSITGTLSDQTDLNTELNTLQNNIDDKLDLTGGTLTGYVSGVTPTLDAHLVTKQYADNLSSGSIWGSITGTLSDQTDLNSELVTLQNNIDDKLDLTGGILTGSVFGITPTAVGHLTRKDYVDSTLATGLNDKLDLTGGTLTGYVSGVTPTLDAHLVTKQYADNLSSGSIWGAITGTLSDQTDLNSELVTLQNNIDDKLDLTGGVLTGPVQGVNPSAVDHLTRKDYVDGALATGLSDKLDLAGGTLTGPVLGTTPTADPHLTRKDYVDGLIQTVSDNYYLKTDHISVSSGAADAGKPLILGANGTIDASMVAMSDLIYQGTWTPEAGTEYPTTGGDGTSGAPLDEGMYWEIDNVGAGYTFTAGDLNGEVIYNLDKIKYSLVGWTISRNALDASAVYYLDGSNPLTADFAGGNYKLANIADAVLNTDAATLGQTQALITSDLTAGLALKLDLTGGALTGPVQGVNPSAIDHLTRKDYVDGALATGLSGKLDLTGGTLTGAVQGITPTSDTHLTRKDYVDTEIQTVQSSVDTHITEPNPHNKMNYVGKWLGSSYKTNDVVYEAGWTMVAINDTTDHAAPQSIGQPGFDLDPEPSWSIGNHVGEVTTTVNYVLTKGGWAQEVWIKVPEVSDTITHSVTIVDTTDPEYPLPRVITLPELTPDVWSLILIEDNIKLVGAEAEINLTTTNSAQTTTIEGRWQRDGDSNNGNPPSGGWLTVSNKTLIRINKTDYDGADRSAELLTCTHGTTVRFQDQDPDKWIDFIVDGNPIDEGDSYEYNVTYEGSTGPSGEPEVMGICTADLETPYAPGVNYMYATDYWDTQPDWTTLTTTLTLDDVPQADTNDAYGIKVKFQEGIISDDWGFLASTSSTSGASGGSTSIHNELEGRDVLDVHPTSSITNLDATLTEKISSDTTETGAIKVDNLVVISQTDYDNLTPNSSTIYMIQG